MACLADLLSSYTRELVLRTDVFQGSLLHITRGHLQSQFPDSSACPAMLCDELSGGMLSTVMVLSMPPEGAAAAM